MLTTSDPEVRVDRVENAPVRGGTHKFAWLTVEGLSPDQNRVSITPGDIGLKRITAIRPAPLGEPFSVAWDGDSVEPGIVFDGWQPDETRVLVEAWGL